MKLCTTSRVTGLDGKEHFAVVAVGQPGWPLALCGPTQGSMAKESQSYAELFAAAPAMLDMLEVLVREFARINPNSPIPANGGKMTELVNLTERAAALVAKHSNTKPKVAA